MQYVLKLYVAGNNALGGRARASLLRVCEATLAGRYELNVIDVLVEPGKAEEDKVVAVPTIVRQQPPPVRRVIGDVEDDDQLRAMLDLKE